MTEAQLAILTSNVFLAAYLGKHWLSAVFFVAYAVASFFK
jgi:hypothetical protein